MLIIYIFLFGEIRKRRNEKSHALIKKGSREKEKRIDIHIPRKDFSDQISAITKNLKSLLAINLWDTQPQTLYLSPFVAQGRVYTPTT